jgi:hypothetical protein
MDKFMFVNHQNVGQNYNIMIANKFFENMAKLKNLETTITNQYYIHEKIKSRLNSGNSCYHLVHNLLSCSLLSKTIKI